MFYHSFWGPSPFFWIILIFLILWAVRGKRHPWHGSHAFGRSPKDILDERFAKGEITEDEYKKSVETLKAHQ